MEFTKMSLLFLLTLLSSSSYMIWSVDCYDFYVGGKDGWVFNPSQTFNHWAAKNKFQIHDNLVFKYKKEEDSVLQVNKEDYLTCNTTNPIMKMGSGDSWFTFQRIGSFFFITGNQCHCDINGQKMVVVVRDGSPRSPGISPSPPSPPSPPSHPSPSHGEDIPTGPSPGPSPSTSGASNKMVSSVVVLMGAVIGCLFV